jgi:hypothetical protein
MKWKDHPNLRKRPSAPSKGRGPVQPDAPHGWDRYPGLRFGTGSAGRGRIQLAVKRAFAAAGTTTLTTSDVFTTRWLATAATDGAAGTAGPLSASCARSPIVLAALIRRAARGCGGSRPPLWRMPSPPRQIEIIEEIGR